MRRTLEPTCQYPDERELGRVLLGERASQWPVIAAVEEKAGLPRVSALYGGRYWPAVKAFYDRRHNVIDKQSEPDDSQAGENFDAWNKRKRAGSKADEAP